MFDIALNTPQNLPAMRRMWFPYDSMNKEFNELYIEGHSPTINNAIREIPFA